MNNHVIKVIYRIIISIITLTTTLSATSQQPTWSIDFGSVFDNREGDHDMTDTKTFLFTSLAPEVGLRFTKHDRISGGIVWTQPIGCEWEGHRISPTLYYRHEGKTWNVAMGMLPRTQLREPLPGFLWCDSLTYFQRNIRGVLVQYNKPGAFLDAYLDWRGMQTDTQREAFNIVAHGEMRFGKAGIVGAHAMMNHYALTRNAPDDQHIVDNFLINPYVGVDLGHATGLDSLVIKGGLLMTVERNRANGGWKSPAGCWIEAVGEWKWLGVKNSLYAGGKLFPSYGEFGSSLYQGEPFYRSSFYNRTDIYAMLINNRYVNFEASVDFNITKGSFIFYQRLLLRVYIDSDNLSFSKRHRASSQFQKLRNIY